MESLDFVRACKLIRNMDYIGLQVRYGAHLNYVLFIKNEIYDEKYKSYPPTSAMFKYMADYIYDYRQKSWTKELMPIDSIEITPAEMVLYGRPD